MSDPRPPAIGAVRFGDLRRVAPVSRAFGFGRGRPVDRVYIEAFLERHRRDVRGRVLEVGDDGYTRRFGGERVERADVLDLRADNPHATIVADLARGEGVPAGAFDCAILTQVLQFVYDLPAALRTLERALAPGGVLLATLPALSQVCRDDMDRGGDFWRFTRASVRRLLEEAFGAGAVTVAEHGNVLAAVSFLHGLGAEELEPEELAHHDPDYALVVTARAVKPAGR
ncbi:MAG: methyltransferase domain-containing protein [Gemmatimonadota bacterium]